MEYRMGKSRMLRERQVGHVFDEKSKVLMGNSEGGGRVSLMQAKEIVDYLVRNWKAINVFINEKNIITAMC